MRAYVCEPGWENALADELRSVDAASQCEMLAPGWLQCRHSELVVSDAPAIAFARQTLPTAVWTQAASIARWSRAASEHLIAALHEHHGPWRLHVFSQFELDDPSGGRRAGLIRESVLAELRKKQRRLLRVLHEDADPHWRSEEALVQVGLASAGHGCMACSFGDELQPLRRVVSRFPAGVVEIPADPQAPSRAFAKLAEVELRLGRRITAGESCVDLGSSPGSWARWALARGAMVTAVDRSPLRGDVMGHPRLTFIRGDAFKFLPAAPVDWLLSDVIAFPDRIIELLDAWLSRRLCRRFCVTIKFRGRDEYTKLSGVKALLVRQNVDYCLRRLTHNRNEVTAYGVIGETGERVGC
jgi:23S rRNA (cytidine2498-2'-O)-methyltransferase